jgi:hypothetical protein
MFLLPAPCDIDNSDRDETHSKHDLLCIDKLLEPSSASYASTYPHDGSRIFKVNFDDNPRDHTNEIVDLKFVELPENFPRNLDSFLFLTRGEGVRNPFEVCARQVQFRRNQSLHDIVVKNKVCGIFFSDRYGSY